MTAPAARSVAILGGGKIGEALLSGLLRGERTVDDIVVSEKHPERGTYLEDGFLKWYAARFERKRIEPICRCRRIELIALAIGASQHGVDQLAGAESVAALGELDGLGDCRVSGHASHVQQLIDAESQQVDHIGIETDQSAADSLRENGIERGTLAQHSVD